MKAIYICEGCGTKYDNEAEAIACEAQEPDRPRFKVGDIVTARTHWVDNEKWVANPGVSRVVAGGKTKNHRDDRNCFDSCCNPLPYWVITAIDIEEHRTRYHLATRAIKDYEGNPATGYTYNYNHVLPKKAKGPRVEAIRRSARLLIGRRARSLL